MQLLRQKENFLQNENWQNPRTKKKRSKKKETKKFIYTKRKRNNINKAALQVISEGNTSILATLYICIYS